MAGRPKRGEPDHLRLLQAVSEAFRPAAPIERRELFAGRAGQLGEIFNAVMQPGQHAVVYGERGVGKTSLVTVAAQMLKGADIVTARATCDRSDDFASVWRKALDEITITRTSRGAGFTGQVTESARRASGLLAGGAVTPHDVRKALQELAGAGRVAVVVDEFDRLASAEARGLFADTVKTLSDQLVRATLVLVGVADDVNELLAEHESIERALVQIHMPRMSAAELTDIVAKGLEQAGMTMDDEAVRRIVRLSQGLPHYTHLLAQTAARMAVEDLRTHVTLADVDDAIAHAIDRAQQSLTDAYVDATLARRPSVYPKVVLACSLAKSDEFGFFTAADARKALRRISGEPPASGTFAQRVDELASDERGKILQRKGTGKSYRYRFRNPLLQPYVVMRALSEGEIPSELLRSNGDASRARAASSAPGASSGAGGSSA